MIEICHKKECTGCGCCASVCPQNCIQIAEDEFGYIYPAINYNICTNCGLCKKSCPNNKKISFSYPSDAYAAWALDEKERMSSTSGGIASVLARKIILGGGVVYGAVGYGAGFVEHQRAETINEIEKFKKSKYVQSTIGKDIYQQIKRDLTKGQKVLFIGTPCQTIAARKFSHGNDNLICVDIICHGVPSSQLLQDHIQMVLGNKNSSINSFSTRDWGGYSLTLFDNNKIMYHKSFPEDEYLNAFQYGLFFRPSCYQCHYARPERVSDLTIGDFWGLGKTDYSHHKVSVILVNTKIGNNLLKSIEDELFLDKRSVEEAIYGNPQLIAPSVKHEFYDLFRKLYVMHGYKIAIKRSLRKFYIKHTIYRICNKIPGFTKFYDSKKKK